jgi:tetratricopeptide (TPR) repeat protein
MSRWFVCAFMLMSAVAHAGPEAEAASAEARAFQATDEKRWCDAVALFLEADTLAPSADLLFNAAQAAGFGGDRAQAKKLFQESIARAPKSRTAADARKALAPLEKSMKSEGPGVSCLASAPATLPTATQGDATSTTPPMPTTTPTPTPPTPATPLPTPTTPPAGNAGLPVAAIATTVVGGVLLLGGSAAAVVGMLPYYDHQDAAAQIRAQEAAGAAPSSVDALQTRQAQARGAWQTWGKITAPVGVVAAGVGLVVVIGGVVWWVAGASE